ncbi:MAG: HDIG domain-containing protein [Muribaculaceae bacterium]|nr:HDIG domain-containing protein [Muribaculaceae bacterium]
MPDIRKIIDKYYPADAPVRGILIAHSRMVAAEALAIAARKSLPLDEEEILAAAMLHDIGIVFTDADGIGCHGSEPYIRHGVVGAELLRREDVDEKYARVAERHTGAGLTHEEILARALPLPLDRSYMPETLLERLICYADCFWSKPRPLERKSLERVRAGMERHGSEIAARFEALHREFS